MAISSPTGNVSAVGYKGEQNMAGRDFIPAGRSVGIARRVGRRRRAKSDSYQPPLTHPSWVNINGGWYNAGKIPWPSECRARALHRHADQPLVEFELILGPDMVDRHQAVGTVG
jgi:hypothetical protein